MEEYNARMKEFKVRGIVLREVFVGEADKILTIFAKDYGKISVRARGARRSKSKFLAGTQLFAYSDFIVFTRGKHYFLSQVDVIESFYDIRSDYDRLCYANYFLEISDKILMEGMESNNILLLLLKTLKAVCNDRMNLSLVARIFELKLLDYSGYRPEVQACNLCNKEVKEADIYFNREGIVCSKCVKISSKMDIFTLNETSIYAMRYILYSELSNLYNFNLDNHSLKELQQACKLLMSELGLNIKSLSFINF